MKIMLADERRARLEDLAGEQRASFAELSRVLGRNEAYVSDYLRRKVPYDLSDPDRSKLARYFGVDEDTLRPRRAPTSLRARLTRRPTFRGQDQVRSQDPA